MHISMKTNHQGYHMQMTDKKGELPKYERYMAWTATHENAVAQKQTNWKLTNSAKLQSFVIEYIPE